MAALVKRGGSDDIYPGGPFFSNLVDAGLLVSLARTVDVYCPPRKRSRVTAPLILRAGEKAAEGKQQPRSIDTLPDECLFEILRRLPGDKERSNSACVSKRWLMLLSSICSSQLIGRMKPSLQSVNKPLPDLNEHPSVNDQEIQNNGFLTRRLEAEEATDIRLSAIALGTCSRGGLGKLFIQGNDSTKVSDVGLSAIAHACPSLRALSMWKVPLVTDAGLEEIANECPLLEKLDLCHCPQISDKGLIAVALKCPNLMTLTIEASSNISNKALQFVGRCCSKLKYVTIKDCPEVGDQGIASLVSSPSSSLERIKLQALNISDLALAVIGQYGKNLIDLSLVSLQKVGEKGFWVMGNTCGLQKLRSISITCCSGLTDIGLQAVAKGSPLLKQLFVRKSCYLSDAGLRAFAEKARALENFHLENCNRVTFLGVLSVLFNCPKLNSLALMRCLGIRDLPYAPAQLPSCMSLESLIIQDCPDVTSASLQMVGKICPQLQKIDLGGQAGVTDALLIPLIENSKVGIVEVNLRGCVNVSDALITILAKAHGSTLKMLNLDGCTKITDRSLMAIATCCFVLDDLDLSGCSIGNYGVAVLASAKQLSLRVLSLASCSITTKCLPFLANMGQSVVGLNLQQCRLITSDAVAVLEQKLWWCDIIS
ncbi:EIN3-binding F-box protein 1-like [Zingiber officinale]|uniref:EIN3-binding F-box protein 1-like n=1 Tax=Zingiber officinale TaxID=94328 RepID=UPI001C4B96C4|nr:EIN3-binding F-box protein 1-like [Zingiber officinale]